MALSKKKSRPIIVDEREYRWQFFENSGWNDVTIQDAEGTGAKLIIQLPSEHSGTPDISLTPPVTPKLVRELIDKALRLGWQPTHAGKTLRMRLSDNKLIEL